MAGKNSRPNGKGDQPRKVNGPKYRDNYDGINWGPPKDWDYPEGSKTKEQRIAAMKYAAEMNLQEERDQSRADTMSLLHLIYDIRKAVGDPEGRLMQDELVAKCRELYQLSNPESK